MAQNEVELTFKWENDVVFEVDIRDNQHALTLVKMEENGQISELWPAASDLMERYVKSLMARIGQDMAS